MATNNFLLSRKIILWLFLMLPCPAFCASNAFVPPAGKTLLLVGQDRDTIAYYVHEIGDVPGGTMLYTSIQNTDGLDGPIDYGSGSMDGSDLLRNYPNSVIQVGLYMVGALEGTIAGMYDFRLATLAQWIKNANRPIYLRIGYEFDNSSNHYDPLKYKQAFRYVVDYLRNAGVNNATYVWHTDCADHPGEHWMDWYPGDDYVDWFGVSLFSTGQIPMASNFLKLARGHGKPFMICESTPWGIYTTRGKIDWFNRIFHFIEDKDVEAFCYINSDWDQEPMWADWKIGDARLQKDDETKELWITEIGDDRYLHASPGLFQILGWNPPRT